MEEEFYCITVISLYFVSTENEMTQYKKLKNSNWIKNGKNQIKEISWELGSMPVGERPN